ncbi:RnfABCDGE type electron transport complex subunit G [Alteromonas sp. BL110]|uniref:RnfABCDGE type electron transport complex subunit G n=1 Tax=Alteromonas sp. BL110 TaxID=1714845 RepID=UPI000E498D2B|nr:RnfABCDGE type electron transport complex subunit G [Alteromonas sp. BL110]AXT37534.1 RnfABCDGE type electron transport complex subunit G [Alteromonas sp. BL110]RKM80273.1 RnfABCDGE type electron transport complex subunit G [Alteromonas sp. BL110]
MMKESLAKNGLMLGAFAVVTTALIALTFFGTQDKIEQQKQQKLLSVLNEVVPSEFHDNALYANCTEVEAPELGIKKAHKVYRATLNGEPSALVLEATAPDGYSGDIDIVVGVKVELHTGNHKQQSMQNDARSGEGENLNTSALPLTDMAKLDASSPEMNTPEIKATNMRVLGVRVIEHKETPGLGDKIELAVSNWITTFSGKSFSPDNLAPWQVKKDGGEFDQFTGATITPRAVVTAVREALLYAQANQNALFTAPNTCATTDSVETIDAVNVDETQPHSVEEL